MPANSAKLIRTTGIILALFAGLVIFATSDILAQTCGSQLVIQKIEGCNWTGDSLDGSCSPRYESSPYTVKNCHQPSSNQCKTTSAVCGSGDGGVCNGQSRTVCNNRSTITDSMAGQLCGVKDCWVNEDDPPPSTCGNGNCQSGNGETCNNCPSDCTCDGSCGGYDYVTVQVRSPDGSHPPRTQGNSCLNKVYDSLNSASGCTLYWNCSNAGSYATMVTCGHGKSCPLTVNNIDSTYNGCSTSGNAGGSASWSGNDCSVASRDYANNSTLYIDLQKPSNTRPNCQFSGQNNETMTVGETRNWDFSCTDAQNDLNNAGVYIKQGTVSQVIGTTDNWTQIYWTGNRAAGTTGSIGFNSGWTCPSAGTYQLVLGGGDNGLPTNSILKCSGNPVGTNSARCASGKDRKEIICQSACNAPSAPTVAKECNGNGTASVTVNWNDVSGATSYHLQIDGDNNWSDSNNNDHNNIPQSSFTYTTAIPNTTHWARVQTNCGSNTSAWSAASSSPGGGPIPCVSTPDCSAPTGLTEVTDCSGSSSKTINLDWNNVTGCTQYEIDKNTTNSFPNNATGNDFTANSQFTYGSGWPKTSDHYFRVRCSQATSCNVGNFWSSSVRSNQCSACTVTLDPASLNMQVGDQIDMDAIGTGPVGTPTLNWSDGGSSRISILNGSSISNKVIRADAVGSATVSVTMSGNGLTCNDTASVTVTDAPVTEACSVSLTGLSLDEGDSGTLTAVVSGESGGTVNRVEFSSSHNGRVSVTSPDTTRSNGFTSTATATGAGGQSATITARALMNGVVCATDTATVSINDTSVEIRTCNQSCGAANQQCDTGLVCRNSVCKNASCTNAEQNASCVCQAATPNCSLSTNPTTVSLDAGGDTQSLSASVTNVQNGTFQRVEFSESSNRFSVNPTSSNNQNPSTTITSTNNTGSGTLNVNGIVRDSTGADITACTQAVTVNVASSVSCNVTLNTLSLDQGDSGTLTALISNQSGGTVNQVTFTSSNNGRVSVTSPDNNSSGGFTSTATATGNPGQQATITARAFMGGVECGSDTAVVRINDEIIPTATPTPTPAPCTCDVTNITPGGAIDIGETRTYTANVTTQNCTVDEVNFSLNNTNASITPNQDSISPYRTSLTALSTGNTRLTANVTTSDGTTCSRSRNISISEPNACEVNLVPANTTINIGQRRQFTAVLTNVVGTVDEVRFNSFDSSIASIVPGESVDGDGSDGYTTRVEGQPNPGTTQIGASVIMGGVEVCSDATPSIVTVEPPTCSFNVPANLEVDKLANVTLQLSNVTSNGTIQRVEFSSDNPSIASVNPASDSTVVYSTQVTGEEISASPADTAIVTSEMYMYGSVICSGTTEVTVRNPDPWWQAINGDVQVRGSVASKIAGGCTGGTCDPHVISGQGLLSYTGTLGVGSGSVSTQGWQARADYLSPFTYGYEFFDTRISSNVPRTNLPTNVTAAEIASGGTLHEGYYWYYYNGNNHSGSDVTISGAPINLGNRRVILQVENADINIDTQIHVDDGLGTFIVIADQDIVVSETLGGTDDGNEEIEGIFISDGVFATSTAGDDADTQIHIRGIIVANGGVAVDRDLPDNSQTPAEVFEYGVDQAFLFPTGLSAKRIQWKEVAP